MIPWPRQTTARVTWLVVAAATAVAASATLEAGVFTSLYEPPQHQDNFIVSVINSEFEGEVLPQGLKPMTALGRRLACAIPSSNSAKQQMEQVAAENVRHVAQGLKALSCVRLEEGSKRYVVCPGQHVRSEGDNGAAVTLYDKHQAGLDNIHFVPSGTVYLTQSFKAAPAVSGGRDQEAFVHYTCDAKEHGGSHPHRVAAVQVHPLTGALEAYVIVRDSNMCAYLASSTEIMGTLEDTCYQLSAGWWTYKVCVGAAVRQYHVGQEGQIETEYSLGVFQAVQGNTLSSGSDNRQAIVQWFDKGDTCDLTGLPRKTKVLYECSADGTVTVRDFREVSTCVYEVVIVTPVVCAHPAFKPVALENLARETKDIQCRVDV